MKNFDLSLYFVTDSSYQEEEKFLAQIDAACSGGVTCVQVREKKKSSRAYYETVLAVKKITDRYRIPLIVDDRLDIALSAGAAGVHLGGEDLPVKKVREIADALGRPDFIIGATAKTVDWALDEEAQGADYLGVGAIYPTATKVKTVLTSVDTLKAIRDRVHIPLVAIGGLNAENLDVLKDAQIAGISVVRALQLAEDPAAAVKRLRGRAEELGILAK